MLKFIFQLVIVFIAPLTLLGQIKTVKTSVFFDNDKFELRPDGQLSIDSALDTLLQANIFKIIVSGNTDSAADSLYNLALSENRAAAVKYYLTTKGLNGNIIIAEYFGEEKPIATNDEEEGKQKNRRVDIIFFYESKESPKSIANDSIPAQGRVDEPCKGDTVILLPEGTQLVFSRCEYLEIKNCLEFTETNNPQSILLNGLSLMDSSGFPIASCGMLRVTLNPGCTDRDCFKVPVKVRFPVPKDKDCDYCRLGASVWEVTPDGHWIKGEGKKSEVKTVQVHGQMFYQFLLYCPNRWRNCDCKVKGRKLKFKTKAGYQIENVTVAFDCPTAVIKLEPKGRKNVVSMKKVPCWKGNKTVFATIVDDKGDTLHLQQQPLNDLPKRTMFSRCKRIKNENIGYRLGIFPIAKRARYRKYLIQPNLLTMH